MRVTYDAEVDVHKPLITTEVFERVQHVLAAKRVDRPNARVFTYSQLVRCASCAYSLIAGGKRKTPWLKMLASIAVEMRPELILRQIP